VSLIAAKDYSGALRMIDWLIEAYPKIGYERLDRGLVNYHLERYDESLIDMRMYLSSSLPSTNSELAKQVISKIKKILQEDSRKSK
jgi:regulator of sirC expression with transglutaminase-like and TPR domain